MSTTTIDFAFPASEAKLEAVANRLRDRNFEVLIVPTAADAKATVLVTDLTIGMRSPDTSAPPRIQDGILADRDAIRAFAQKGDSITGFIASEYPIALLVRDVLRELGRLEMTMITCFDSPRGQFVEPRFTHVQQNEREIGRRAVDLLLNQINGEQTPSQSIVPYELVTVPGEGKRRLRRAAAFSASNRYG